MSEGKIRSVFLLWHIRPMGAEAERSDEKLIGVYDAELRAKEAIARLTDKPGFREFPQGFEVHEFVLNRDGWTEGFLDLCGS